MQFIDITIISSSYLLFHSTETIVYGIAFTLIASYVCDYVVNGSRQTVQFIIISKDYEKIADQINQSAHRGVTVVEGKAGIQRRKWTYLSFWQENMSLRKYSTTLRISTPMPWFHRHSATACSAKASTR